MFYSHLQALVSWCDMKEDLSKLFSFAVLKTVHSWLNYIYIYT